MNKENTCIEQKEFVKYIHGFEYAGKLYGFKNKNLFLLSGSSPEYIEMKVNHNQKGYYLGRDFVSLEKIKPITKEINLTVDISNLQWYIQEDLKMGIYIKR